MNSYGVLLSIHAKNLVKLSLIRKYPNVIVRVSWAKPEVANCFYKFEPFEAATNGEKTTNGFVINSISMFPQFNQKCPGLKSPKFGH